MTGIHEQCGQCHETVQTEWIWQAHTCTYIHTRARTHFRFNSSTLKTVPLALINTHPSLWCSNRHRMSVKPLQSHQVQSLHQGCVLQRIFPIIPRQTTYRTSPHPSCLRSRCRSRTASGPGRNGCSCSGTDMAHTSSHLPCREKRMLKTEFTGLQTFKIQKNR